MHVATRRNKEQLQATALNFSQELLHKGKSEKSKWHPPAPPITLPALPASF
ncbi:unnamed protein product [Prunus armeniaca]|uniref:Uncharacterized protein n=1 Tax=Prunus armeniaca TaxID=36596 RepID=A0A6J5UZ67_PRUAR|nr:unnamed protein product [Prunus armeniaca]CAB4311128.1 unnamed protein product [Prunus armeniaca]